MKTNAHIPLIAVLIAGLLAAIAGSGVWSLLMKLRFHEVHANFSFGFLVRLSLQYSFVCSLPVIITGVVWTSHLNSKNVLWKQHFRRYQLGFFVTMLIVIVLGAMLISVIPFYGNLIRFAWFLGAGVYTCVGYIFIRLLYRFYRRKSIREEINRQNGGEVSPGAALKRHN